MQWSLFLLILMGQCSFLTCHIYEYHFVDEEKTWSQAQKHCKEKYTDLATVSNMTDMMRLHDKYKAEAWIGLRNHTDANRTWHWSLPGVEFNKNETRWAPHEPNDKVFPENCVIMKMDGWVDVPCIDTFPFICYNDAKQSSKTFHLIERTMTWPQAQSYCREHHTDLVSGLQQIEEFIKEKKRYADLWIGLFRDTWKWSDGSSFSFRNWDLEFFKDEKVDKKCAMTMSDGKWRSDDCNNKKPFFCYDDNVILIKKNKTWVEALYYCQDHHHDLVSITNLDEQRWVQERAKMANTSHVWLGLRYTCTLDFWFWISDEAVRYQNWDSPGQANDCDMSGAMDSGGQHKWFKKIDHEEFNFICSTE